MVSISNAIDFEINKTLVCCRAQVDVFEKVVNKYRECGYLDDEFDGDEIKVADFSDCISDGFKVLIGYDVGDAIFVHYYDMRVSDRYYCHDGGKKVVTALLIPGKAQSECCSPVFSIIDRLFRKEEFELSRRSLSAQRFT